MKILYYFLIFVMCQSSVNAGIIEIPFPSGNLVVRGEMNERSLYLDDQPVGITDAYISINRMVPTQEGMIDVYLIETSTGGSGTMPGYYFLTIGNTGKFKVSEDFGAGALMSLKNDGKTIAIEFDALYNRFDNSLVSPAITVTYQNGRVSIKEIKPEKKGKTRSRQ